MGGGRGFGRGKKARQKLELLDVEEGVLGDKFLQNYFPVMMENYEKSATSMAA